MSNSTYYEPEDLGPEQDARDAAIPGRKYYVYVLETDFGHYVGHTARLPQRINEHIRGDEPTTRDSNPEFAWNSGPFSTRDEAARFEAALKSWREQRSGRFEESTGLRPEPFIRYKLASDDAEQYPHSSESKSVTAFEEYTKFEDSYPEYVHRRTEPLVPSVNNRGHLDRNDQMQGIRGIDLKKALAWFVVVFVLTVTSGYVLGFRAAEIEVDGFAIFGIMVGATALVVIVYMARNLLQNLFGRIAPWRPLYRPIEGNIRNTVITVVVASVLAAGAGGFGGYVLGLSTAQSVIDLFWALGIATFVLIVIALIFLLVDAYQKSEQRRSRQTRWSRNSRQTQWSRNRRRWHR